jgi:hypothetical protein
MAKGTSRLEKNGDRSTLAEQITTPIPVKEAFARGYSSTGRAWAEGEEVRGHKKMDVLKYWSPTIDWNCFAQGAVSDRMWSGFKDLVILCHCVEHWREAVHSHRMSRPRAPLHTPETPYRRKKRLDEWRQPIRECDTHMHRAAHLADEKLDWMSNLPTAANEDTPDWKLLAAAALSIGKSRGHEQARYKSVAFDAFDVTELSEPDPSVIASQWLVMAGYSPTTVPQL